MTGIAEEFEAMFVNQMLNNTCILSNLNLMFRSNFTCFVIENAHFI